ncbi:hypothetical protein SCB71_11380 [Herbiconiux sp. KACC 21604]|uniref:hypothetical protein n=1 Tax=unclassified Herbiconiux TaxID=2618217 RepID=UPI0014923E76|nr:hypothetical protein [Herbiconiux sp. SALV-R1]QJU53816.1 hypothetical protein HL652_09330 [Herbiconiux sp. SALV-R1]WPO84825.1 hypothetical protein SCB71_11380 [Herbiconiux sp. KACC 21604]
MSGQTNSRVRTRPSDDGVLTQLVRARRLGPDAVEALRNDLQRDSRLGLGYLGVGSAIVGIILIGRGLVSFGWTLPTSHWLWLTAAAWLLVVAAFAVLTVSARRRRGMVPAGVYVMVLAFDGVALLLDSVALWGSSEPVNYLTVSIGIGATLLAAVTYRPLDNTVAATASLTVLQLADVVARAVMAPDTIGPAVGTLVLSVAPVAAGIIVVRSFGQLVQRELDRTVAESTITAPRYGLGLLASTELARLDLAAEELLQDVATGRVDLPLDRELASTASGLATDLRRMLVAGRRESWLHHAITESEYLNPTVTLVDSDGLAGYLDPAQRDGLLSAVWLILDESGRQTPTIELEIGHPAARTGSAPDDRMVLPIVVSIGGVPRRRIESAVWSALSRVGQYSVESRSGRLRVRVDAHVVVPDPSR